MIECIPINDSKKHDKGSGCPCSPTVLMEDGEMIVVHTAFDGRHLVEQVNEILNNENPPDQWEVIEH